jgi:hypothetical protein
MLIENNHYLLTNLQRNKAISPGIAENDRRLEPYMLIILSQPLKIIYAWYTSKSIFCHFRGIKFYYEYYIKVHIL